MFLDEDTNQVLYADDGAAVCHLSGLRKWFDSLVCLGPSYGYYVNEEKTWLVVKPDCLDRARSVFNDTYMYVNITSDGRPYLGSPLGSVTYMEESVKSKVELWNATLRSLSEILNRNHMQHIVLSLMESLASGYIYVEQPLKFGTYSVSWRLLSDSTCYLEYLVDTLQVTLKEFCFLYLSKKEV